MPEIKWAIIAPGNIARSFATALNAIPSAVCYGVAGRSLQRSQAFADEFGFNHAFPDTQSLLADPAIDVVYIASPHNAHHQQTLDCLNAGKAVLCEKPMTVNAQQALEVFAAAEHNRQFYMEAVWTRFLPIYSQIRSWLDDGVIGDVRFVTASFGIHPEIDRQHRLLNPDLAGGSILDLAIYPLTLADWVYGESPLSVHATGHVGSTGVDEQVAATLAYSDGRTAQLFSAVNVNTPLTGKLFGTKGRIEIDPPFFGGESATLFLDDPTASDISMKMPHAVNGYVYEAEEVQRCLTARIQQSSALPWAVSLRTMKILDDLRARLGVRYSLEKAN